MYATCIGAFVSPPRRPQRLAVCFLVSALLLAASAAGAAAQETATSSKNGVQRGTPRMAMTGFLEACRAGDYPRAAQYLDLSRLNPAARAARGPVLARELKTALDRTLWVDLDELSDEPDGVQDDGLPPQQDLVGTIDTSKGPVPILVERGRLGGTPVWTVAAATVARIPALYEEFGHGRLGEYLPNVFFDIRFLDVELWQWMGFLALIVVSVVLSWMITILIVRLLRPIIARSRAWRADRQMGLAVGPLRVIVAVALFSAGTYPLGLAVPVQAFLTALQKTLTIVAVTWLLVRLLDVAAGAVQERLAARGQAAAQSVVPLGRRTVQVLLIALAGLAALQNLGINVTGILAGLGIGGLAVALAAQKTVENLFGGVTLIADQPVRVGDFCRFGEKIGTIEQVGLRSTRVRTLDRTVVTIPNSEFAAMQLENYTRRDRIWFHPTIGLRYETTPDQLRYVLVELKKLLVAHPKVHPEPARPRFVGFGAYSLDIEIFAYVTTADINEFLAVQEDLLLRIMDIVEASGTGFAFPSQTIYTGQDTGLNGERARAAEMRVRAWREEHALGLPQFRPEQLAPIVDTLDYPPKGSAVAG
jgi:MscS family membrane protein